MIDIDEIRRANLRRIEAEFGGPAGAAARLNMSTSQFVNLRNGARDSKTGKPRGMRKETARRIEEAAGKPEGWLDIPPDGAPSEPETPVFARKAAAPQQRNPDVQSALLDLARELERGDLSPEARDLLTAELQAKTRYVRDMLTRYLNRKDV